MEWGEASELQPWMGGSLSSREWQAWGPWRVPKRSGKPSLGSLDPPRAKGGGAEEVASMSACFRLCPSVGLECPRTLLPPFTLTLPRTLQSQGLGGTRCRVSRRERMQLGEAPRSRGVPIPHPIVVGGGLKGVRRTPGASPRAGKNLKWSVVCSCWGCGRGKLDKGQRGHPKGKARGPKESRSQELGERKGECSLFRGQAACKDFPCQQSGGLHRTDGGFGHSTMDMCSPKFECMSPPLFHLTRDWAHIGPHLTLNRSPPPPPPGAVAVRAIRGERGPVLCWALNSWLLVGRRGP